jgi:molecular chaperone GrpE
MLEVLKREGVEVVGGEEVRRQFDPERHEALMRQPAGAGGVDGEVVSVLRQGYAVKGRLVRPALVVVAYSE